MLLFGMLFFGIGLFFAIVFIAISLSVGDMMFGFIGGGLGILFTIIGGVVLVKYIKNMYEKKFLIETGTRITGMIVDYEYDSSIVVNGSPAILLVVQADYMGALRRFVVETGKYSNKNYPVGAFVDLAVNGVDAALIKGSVRFIDGIGANDIRQQY